MHPAPDNTAQINQCLRDLRLTDPRTDKVRIVHQKDDLLKGACDWVLETPEFCSWYNGADSQLLWIKGDPGKGKTMMAIALIDELSRRLETNSDLGVLSYFFCQNTDSRLNNAISVLRGLIYMLVTEWDTLVEPLKLEYERAGPELFEGPNVFFDLQRILQAMLKIPNHGTIYLVVDALDECGSELSELLALIANNGVGLRCQVKWLVTSRNREEIERKLRLKNPCLKVSLELNSSCVSRAVDSFVDIKVQKLAQEEEYNTELKEEVSRHLKDNAKGTFLWVALACKMLEGVLAYHIKSTLEEFPPGLDPIYERMMKQIEYDKHVKICKRIIISAILAFRPLHLKELGAIADLPIELRESLSSLKRLVQFCGSFLTIQENIVYFVHQSAKDFFITDKGSKIFSSSRQEEHGKIAYWSLDFMSSILKENICDLQKPGVFAAEAQRRFCQSRFTHIEYACCYWVDHLAVYLTNASRDKYDQLSPFDNRRKVKMFLRGHFLHWLEALSLLEKVSDGVLMFKRLQSLIDVSL